MAQIQANGITIEADTVGPDSGEPLLMICGLGMQLTRWPPALLEKLNARGFRVIRFDNRDTGLSAKFNDAGIPDLAQVVAARTSGQKPDVPYTLDDMAADAVGVLDHFGIDKAHVVGVSMGGMIGQLVAADYPDRVLSFTSVMSSTGNPDLAPATKEAMAVLRTRAPDPKVDRDGFIAQSIKSARTIGSPAFPLTEESIVERALSDAERCYNPEGIGRQMAAVYATGDRRERLAFVVAPTVVLHGADDPLVPLGGGEDTAANIAGAELRVIRGMGHDLPPELFDTVVEAIVAAVDRSRGGAPAQISAA